MGCPGGAVGTGGTGAGGRGGWYAWAEVPGCWGLVLGAWGDGCLAGLWALWASVDWGTGGLALEA